MTPHRVRALGVGALWLLWAALAWAQAVLPVPELSSRVIDQTGTLDPAQKSTLESRLAAFEAERGTQIVVVLVPTTQPEDIADYTQRLGDAWKIGRQDVGDGVLFVVAKNDRRVRIATSKTLEGAIPDLVARRIIDQGVTPAFRRNDFAGGIQAGVDQIIAQVSGENLPLPEAGNAPNDEGFAPMDLLIFLVFAVPIFFGRAAQPVREQAGHPAHRRQRGCHCLGTHCGVLDRRGRRPAGHAGRAVLPDAAVDAIVGRRAPRRWRLGRRRVWRRWSRRRMGRWRLQFRRWRQFRGRRRFRRLVTP